MLKICDFCQELRIVKSIMEREESSPTPLIRWKLICDSCFEKLNFIGYKIKKGEIAYCLRDGYFK